MRAVASSARTELTTVRDALADAEQASATVRDALAAAEQATATERAARAAAERRADDEARLGARAAARATVLDARARRLEAGALAPPAGASWLAGGEGDAAHLDSAAGAREMRTFLLRFCAASQKPENAPGAAAAAPTSPARSDGLRHAAEATSPAVVRVS